MGKYHVELKIAGDGRNVGRLQKHTMGTVTIVPPATKDKSGLGMKELQHAFLLYDDKEEYSLLVTAFEVLLI